MLDKSKILGLLCKRNPNILDFMEKGNETGKSDGRGKSNKAIREERECEENSVLGRVLRDCCVDSIYKFSHTVKTICPLGHRQERGQARRTCEGATANAEKRYSPEWSADTYHSFSRRTPDREKSKTKKGDAK